MTLIAILLALGIVNALKGHFSIASWLEPERSLWSFDAMLGRHLSRMSMSYALAIRLIVPVLISVALLEWLWAGFELAFSAVLLVLLMGANKAHEWIEGFARVWHRHDWSACDAWLQTHTSIVAQSRATALKDFVAAYWLTQLRSTFSPWFWFFIFGVPGLVAYVVVLHLSRVSPSGEQQDHRPFAQQILEAMDFVPARVLALSIAACSEFSLALKAFINRLGDLYVPAHHVVMAACVGGLALSFSSADDVMLHHDGMRYLDRVKALSKRVVLSWLMLASLMTIVGWL